MDTIITPPTASDRGPMFRSTHRAAGTAVLAALLALTGCVVAPAGPRYGPPPGRPMAEPPMPPMYFYPEQGQPEARQERDRYDCYRWAVRQTGMDPGMTPVRHTPQEIARGEPLRDGSGVLAGAATGAVIGAAVSSPRHAGANAVIGAIFGAAIGAAAQESRAQAIEAAQARRHDAAQAARGPMDNFRRAMGACMESNGYRVG